MSRKVTIVHVITRFIRGGADENTLITCNAQAMAGHDVHLVFGKSASTEMLDRLHTSVKRHRIGSLVRQVSPVSDSRALLSVSRLLMVLKPAIVHTHTSKAGIIGRAAAVGTRVPIVIHGVHILPFLNVGKIERAMYLALERLLARHTTVFIHVSDALRQLTLSHGIGLASRHVVIPSGMDVDRFRSAPPIDDKAFASAFGISANAVETCQLIVMVAALERRKRIGEFLREFKRLTSYAAPVYLAVLGEGPLRQELQQQTEELGLRERVAWLGFRDDVDRWIARAAVCVLASEREGLPRAVVQYALAAKPIVVADLPGVDAIVSDGETGFVVPAESLALMPDRIKQILDRPDLANAMSNALRRVELSPWTAVNMLAEIDRIYRSALIAAP
jgi:glycosyltransferase involved in cell wall biosynthesis